MGRRPFVPTALTRGPFTLDDARRHGLERWHLEGDCWRRVGPSAYMWAGLTADPMHLLAAAQGRLPSCAVFSGATAAWLHGVDVEPCSPIEATVPVGAGVSARSGIRVRRSALPDRDIVRLRGMRATSIQRALAEVCGRLTLTESVVLVDGAVHNLHLRLDELQRWAHANAGHHGVRRFRHALTFAEPASESPMESRLRMLLVMGGLPRPRAQVSIRDRWHRFVGRLDLYYEEERLGIEYDGGQHRETLAEDNRRQNRLLGVGVRLLRFTAGDVMGNPDWVVAQVRALLEHGPVNPVSAGRNGK